MQKKVIKTTNKISTYIVPLTGQHFEIKNNFFFGKTKHFLFY